MSVKTFDPNQPRDPHTGEWIGVGGGLVSAAAVEDFLSSRQPEFGPDDIRAFEDYQGSGAHFVNAKLRGDPDTRGMELTGLSEADFDQQRKMLDRAFDKVGPLGRPVQTFRGVTDFNLEPGQTLKDPGFGSTSTSRKVAEDAAALGSKGTVMDLTVHPDVRAVWINRAFPGPLWEHERELLLERGVRYVVQSVEGGVVRVAVLPPA